VYWFSLNWKIASFELAGKERASLHAQGIVQVLNQVATVSFYDGRFVKPHDFVFPVFPFLPVLARTPFVATASVAFSALARIPFLWGCRGMLPSPCRVKRRQALLASNLPRDNLADGVPKGHLRPSGGHAARGAASNLSDTRAYALKNAIDLCKRSAPLLPFVAHPALLPERYTSAGVR
jgi:hypothetical protein